MFEKENDLYIKAAVILNGVTDSQGDTLYKEDIKRIFTSYNNQNSFDLYHDGIPVQGVSLLENYISTSDELIGNTLAPSGSWLIVMRVTCPELQQRILNGELKGVSLGSRIKDSCSCNLTGQITYNDLESAECVIPLFISLVEEGANGVGLEIYDYNNYINKSKNGERTMNLLEEIKALIQRAEEDSPVIEKSAEDESEPVESEEVATPTEDEVAVPSEEEATDSEKEAEKEDESTDEPATITKADDSEDEKESNTEPANKEEDEEKIEKAEITLEDLLARIEALENKLSDSKVEKSEDEPKTDEKETEDEDEVAPTIAKSAKVVITEEATESKNDFYEMTGRDPITGKKL